MSGRDEWPGFIVFACIAAAFYGLLFWGIESIPEKTFWRIAGVILPIMLVAMPIAWIVSVIKQQAYREREQAERK